MAKRLSFVLVKSRNLPPGLQQWLDTNLLSLRLGFQVLQIRCWCCRQLNIGMAVQPVSRLHMALMA